MLRLNVCQLSYFCDGVVPQLIVYLFFDAMAIVQRNRSAFVTIRGG